AWDVVSGQRQHTFGAGNDGTATADIAVAPDGKTLITFEFPGGGVYRYHVWDAESGKARFTFDWKEEAAAPLLRYMPEGNMVTITTIRGRQTRIWDITTGKERSPIQEGYELIAGLGDGQLAGWKSNVYFEWDISDPGGLAQLKQRQQLEQGTEPAFGCPIV